ncbi:hypothetical protein K7432_003950 [Basidiobolus ranarum]|uniref:Uncharacterized protein n=1 Tax=Basidiobolus ranarum TaxID=34480 RepID=A0ABR2W5E7_9FUNG
MSESKRASTRGSGAKKGAQKYQNTTAYRHNKNSKKTREINALPISGLCQRCLDVLEWRKRFRKYKPLTTAKKCVCCQQKAIKEAYHVLCNKCATEKKVCAKCQESKQIVPRYYESHIGRLGTISNLFYHLQQLQGREGTYGREIGRGALTFWHV